MKKEIHPDYFPNASITCSCGAIYKIGSTKEEIAVESCAACHPFYTGKQKMMDTARRVEKFTERATLKAVTATGKKVKKEKPHMILLDIMMPGLNGIETLKRIKEIDKEVAVVGGGDAAMEDILALTKFAKSITFIFSTNFSIRDAFIRSMKNTKACVLQAL